MEEECENYKSFVSSEMFSLVDVNGFNKRINLHTTKFPKLLKKINVDNFNFSTDNFFLSIKEIHRIVTYYENSDVLDGHIVINQGNIQLGQQRRNNLESAFFDLFYEITCLKLDLSKI